MSVLSTLALLVTTAAVKSRPKKADRVAELEAEIVGLKVDLADARRDVDRALSERDALQRALERAQARHGEHPLQQIPAGPDFRPAGLQQAQALALQQYAQQAQCQNALVAQQAQYAAMQDAQVYGHALMQQGLAQQQGLLGDQNLRNFALNPELWCNCVPSRAQVWAARDDPGY